MAVANPLVAMEPSQPITLLAPRPSPPPAAPETTALGRTVVGVTGLAFSQELNPSETCLLPVVVAVVVDVAAY